MFPNCGDDLDGQFSITKKYANEPWNVGGRAEDIVQRVHTRFVQKQVGYHLERFKTSRDLLQAVYDAILGKCFSLRSDLTSILMASFMQPILMHMRSVGFFTATSVRGISL